MKSTHFAVLALVVSLFASITAHAWVAETVDPSVPGWGSEGSVGAHSSIGVDTSDYVHMSYADETNDDLKYATNASGRWVAETVDSGGDVGEYNSIGVDSSDYVHMSYRDETNDDLKYATNASGSWVTETVDPDVPLADHGFVGEYSSIVSERMIFCN